MVLVGVRPLRLLSGLSSPDTPTDDRPKTFEETKEILMRRRSVSAEPPLSAPAPHSSPLLKAVRKRRIQSEDLRSQISRVAR